jgi:RND superfamily putative drug exporter
VLRRVAIAELSADQALDGGTVGELIARRLDATRPWYRLAPASQAASEWARKAALAIGERFDGDTPLESLGAVARAVVATAAALAERPSAVAIDLDEAPGAATTELWDALAVLVPADVALIVGIGRSAQGPPVGSLFAARGVETVDLAALPAAPASPVPTDHQEALR